VNKTFKGFYQNEHQDARTGVYPRHNT